MDVNETLALLRQMVQDRANGSEVDLDAMVDAFDALDGWMSRGGFMPVEWVKSR